MNRKILSVFYNKNPRNLELLRLQRKPTGYEFEKDREIRSYIYKVEFVAAKNYTEGRVIHHENGVIITASTTETQIKGQLVSTIDKNAAQNIARILADRCFKSGIYSCLPGIIKNEPKDLRQTAFFETLEKVGLKLQEPDTIPRSMINDPTFVSDPFLVQHTRQDKLDEKLLELEK